MLTKPGQDLLHWEEEIKILFFNNFWWVSVGCTRRISMQWSWKLGASQILSELPLLTDSAIATSAMRMPNKRNFGQSLQPICVSFAERSNNTTQSVSCTELQIGFFHVRMSAVHADRVLKVLAGPGAGLGHSPWVWCRVCSAWLNPWQATQHTATLYHRGTARRTLEIAGVMIYRWQCG